MRTEDDLVDLVEFRTNKFKPFLPDDAQVNPGVYGAELAYWLAHQLATRGVVTSYPRYEDWGWYILYITEDGAKYAIHCGNVYGHTDLWMLSLRRHARKMFGRDKPSFEKAAALVAAIRSAIIEEEMDAVDWQTQLGV